MHLQLTQHCKSTVLQYKIKKKIFLTEKKVNLILTIYWGSVMHKKLPSVIWTSLGKESFEFCYKPPLWKYSLYSRSFLIKNKLFFIEV